ncbi:hypothetical protein DGG96_13520 [Legionella qingyii]|uniref:Uncharacterized protein n=1 Tax=Legionella qingyii TaxID=2184757 RepID=A0A317U1K4_9GAMM|nr:hypothetical protein DGG96_13520 [Legionella qingyii]RUR25540.1 hypothetical protein ELY20_02710 [Legionella qingyii]RUR28570.1 hypothetical protein ELY16_03300 [Legionella qingyii]
MLASKRNATIYVGSTSDLIRRHVLAGQRAYILLS